MLFRSGVPVERLIDYFSLLGDAIDNIPGVDKVGPKTAVKWITQHGSLDGVIANAASFTGQAGENLRKSLDWLPRGRMLLTVKCDCDLPMGLDALDCGERDDALLAQYFERLGFRTWLKEVQSGQGAMTAGEVALVPGARGATRAQAKAELPSAVTRAPLKTLEDRRYELVVTAEALETWIARLEVAALASFDTETTSLDPMSALLVGLSFAVEPGHAAYVPLAHRYAGAPDQLGVDRVLARLKPWLEDASKKKVAQNGKFDQHVLANHGVRLAGLAHDTLIESYVLESHRSEEHTSELQSH